LNGQLGSTSQAFQGYFLNDGKDIGPQALKTFNAPIAAASAQHSNGFFITFGR
jgi:hypothetical protein